MHNVKSLQRSRQEERLILHLPVRVAPSHAQTTNGTTAYLSNLSWHGACFHSRERFDCGAVIDLHFLSTANGNGYVAQGLIKWIIPHGLDFHIGVALLASLDCCFCLQENGVQVQPRTAPHRNEALLRPAVPPEHCPARDFRAELFWGLFYTTFARVLHHKLVHLTNSTTFTANSLESLLADTATAPFANGLTQKRLQEAQAELIRSSRDLLGLAQLCNTMQRENVSNGQQRRADIPQHVPLATRVTIRLHRFFQKLEQLRIQPLPELHHEGDPQARLYIVPWLLDTALDLLLLQSYRYMLTDGANQVFLTSTFHNSDVSLHIRHNGAPLLRDTAQELRFDHQRSVGYAAAFRDKEQFAWLYYLLCLLQLHSPSWTISSESGNNTLTLRLRAVPGEGEAGMTA